MPFGSARPVWQWLWVLLIAVTTSAICLRHHLKDNDRLDTVQRSLLISPQHPAWMLSLVWVGMASLLTAFHGESDVATNSWPSWLEVGRINPNSLATVAYFVAHFLLFFSLILHIKNRSQTNRFLWVACLVASGYAAYGLFVHFSGANTILWFEKSSSFNSVNATFVNRNNFATFAGLGLLCVLTKIINQWTENIRSEVPWRLVLRDMIEAFTRESWLTMVCFAVLLTALVLTGSRAGTLSVLVAALVLLLVAPPAGNGNKRFSAGLFFCLMLVLGVSLSGDILLSRIASINTQEDGRLEVYRVMIKAIGEAPLSGYGLGRFSEVFATFRNPHILNWFDRAHSDYLELAFTAGIPVLLVLVLTFAPIVWRLYLALPLSGEDRPYVALGVAATIQIGLHSAFDFSMQIPAVSYYYIIILAVSYIQARLRTNGHTPAPVVESLKSKIH